MHYTHDKVVQWSHHRSHEAQNCNAGVVRPSKTFTLVNVHLWSDFGVEVGV